MNCKYNSKHIGNGVTLIRIIVVIVIAEWCLSIYLRDKWPVINFLYYSTAPVIAVWVARIDAISGYISNQPIRIACLIFLFISPYAAISSSIDKSGEVFKDVSSRKVYVHATDIISGNALTYVGKLGGYTFFKEIGSRKMYQVRSEEIKYIEYVLE